MKIQFCLLDVDSIIQGEKATLRLFGVTQKGQSILVLDDRLKPYFYALPKDKEKLLREIARNEKVILIEEDERTLGFEKKEFLKVFVKIPPDTSKVRETIKNSSFLEECYEYAVPYYKRYLMDKGVYPFDWLEVEGDEIGEKYKSSSSSKLSFDIKIHAKKLNRISKKEISKLKVLAFDLEVVDNEIIMVSLADSLGYEEVLTLKEARGARILKDEKRLLEEFAVTVVKRDPDIVVGYNTDQFDFEILRNRSSTHRFDLKLSRDDSSLKLARRGRISSTSINGRVHIDLFAFINNIISPQLQSEVLSLGEVSQELLGDTKIDLSLEEMITTWRSGKDESLSKLVDYCLKDSRLTLKLAHLLLPQIFALSKISGQVPFDCSRMTYGLLVEGFLVRRAAEARIISPNQPHWDEIQKRRAARAYKGGYVKEPKTGLHKNIALFDFRSLYPSIIVTFNLSPETLNCQCCSEGYKVPELEFHFCKKRQGFIPQILKEVVEERVAVKSRLKETEKDSEEYQELNERQFALKVLANAFYGYTAYPGARWYSRECSESAAAFGRYFIKEAIRKASKYGEVLYGDTDSLFLKVKEERQARDFLKKINQSLPGIIELELQGIFERGIFVSTEKGKAAKKRYALIDENRNLLIRGFESVRRDWCDQAKKLQRQILRLVLEGREEEAVALVRKTLEKLEKRKIDLKDIVIRTQLGKALGEYKSKGPHVVVAKKLKDAGHEIQEGMVLSYIISEGRGSISERATPLDQVGIDDYDIEYYANNQIISVALRVLRALGYSKKDFSNPLQTLPL